MEDDHLHLTREGGHSHRRIVHVDDATGWAVQSALLKAAQEHPNITLLPGRSCIDLITGRHEMRYSGSGRVWGVYALDEATGHVETHTACATILATGGAGRVYQYSTAPRGATGDGIAMAWRAGARVGNMEMMQFHPTCLYNLEVKNFLITEAVRGEGGRLINRAAASASCPITTSGSNWPRATSSPAPSTPRSSVTVWITSTSTSAICPRILSATTSPTFMTS
jgi:L-aspartate oxidase